MTRIALREMTESDLPALTGGHSEFDDWGVPAQRRSSIASADLSVAGGLTIADADTDRVLGYVTWHWVRWGPNPESTNPMIGIWLASGGRGRGIGTRAQRRLVEAFFTKTSAQRVEAQTDVANVAEQKALENAGFTREGRARAAQWRRGAFHDLYLYAVLRSEWNPTDSANEG